VPVAVRPGFYRFLSVSTFRPSLPCWRAVGVVDGPGRAGGGVGERGGWGVGELVDVGSTGQRAAVAVAELPGDDAGGFLPPPSLRPASGAAGGDALCPGVLGEGPERPAGVLGSHWVAAPGAQQQVQ